MSHCFEYSRTWSFALYNVHIYNAYIHTMYMHALHYRYNVGSCNSMVILHK